VDFNRTDIQLVDEFRRSAETSVLTVMFTDIKGFTSITEDKGDEYANTLRREHDNIIVPLIEKDNAGRVIKHIGDAVMAVFAEPSAAVQTALAEWCTRGDLVYHGLSGQFLLKEIPGVLRVRLVAPMEMRIKAFLDTHPLMSHSEAETFIRNVDQDRSRWCRLLYGADVTDTSHYDMTVNLKRLSLESGCATIAEAASQPRYQITDEVETELFAFAARCRERLARAIGE